MWSVTIEKAKHSGPAQRGEEQSPKLTTVRERDAMQKPRDVGSRGNRQAGCCKDAPWTEAREDAGDEASKSSSEGRGHQEDPKAPLCFCLKRLWGGDGHPCALPSCRASSGDTCSVLMPNRHPKQNAYWMWALSQKPATERPAQGRELVAAQPKEPSETPSQGKGR